MDLMDGKDDNAWVTWSPDSRNMMQRALTDGNVWAARRGIQLSEMSILTCVATVDRATNAATWDGWVMDMKMARMLDLMSEETRCNSVAGG